MKKTRLGLAATGAAAALVVAAGAPGFAATIVSQSSATAVSLSIAGQGSDSGTVTATNDGSGEKVDGQANPPVAVLGNQGLANVGVLAQEAEAKVTGRDGVSRACSGVAGDGGAVAQIGDSGCLTPGQPVGLSIAHLALGDVVTIDPNSALGPLAAANPVVQQLLGPITDALVSALQATPIGDLDISGTLGAVQAACSATPGAAKGAANIVDSTIDATVGGQTVNLLTLPAEPAPNTEVVTDLDQVLDVILQGLNTDLNNSLTGALSPLTGVTGAIQQQIVDAVVKQVADQLQPLQDNVLRLTLNRQSSSGTGQVAVTALHLEVLPAAQQFAGSALVGGDIATVTCGPNARVTATSTPTPTPGGGPNGGGPNGPGHGPKVPTVIDAGASAGTPWGLGALAAGALGAGAAAGLVTRRTLARR